MVYSHNGTLYCKSQQTLSVRGYVVKSFCLCEPRGVHHNYSALPLEYQCTLWYEISHRQYFANLDCTAVKMNELKLRNLHKTDLTGIMLSEGRRTLGAPGRLSEHSVQLLISEL